MADIRTLYFIAREENISVDELIASEIRVMELDIIPAVSLMINRKIFNARANVVALFRGFCILLLGYEC